MATSVRKCPPKAMRRPQVTTPNAVAPHRRAAATAAARVLPAHRSRTRWRLRRRRTSSSGRSAARIPPRLERSMPLNCVTPRAAAGPNALEAEVREHAGRQDHRRQQEHDGAALHQQRPVRPDQLPDQRADRRQHERPGDPHRRVAGKRRRPLELQREGFRWRHRKTPPPASDRAPERARTGCRRRGKAPAR